MCRCLRLVIGPFFHGVRRFLAPLEDNKRHVCGLIIASVEHTGAESRSGLSRRTCGAAEAFDGGGVAREIRAEQFDEHPTLQGSVIRLPGGRIVSIIQLPLELVPTRDESAAARQCEATTSECRNWPRPTPAKANKGAVEAASGVRGLTPGRPRAPGRHPSPPAACREPGHTLPRAARASARQRPCWRAAGLPIRSPLVRPACAASHCPPARQPGPPATWLLRETW